MIPRELLDLMTQVAFLAMAAALSIVLVSGLLRLAQRERSKIRLLNNALTGPQMDVLRVGDRAIVTMSCNMDIESACAALASVSKLVSDDLTHMVLELEGSALDAAALSGFVTDVGLVCRLAGVRLSLVTSDRDLVRTLGQSPSDPVPVYGSISPVVTKRSILDPLVALGPTST